MPHVDQKSIECGELKRSRKERSNGREGVPQPDALRVQGANMRLKTSWKVREEDFQENACDRTRVCYQYRVQRDSQIRWLFPAGDKGHCSCTHGHTTGRTGVHEPWKQFTGNDKPYLGFRSLLSVSLFFLCLPLCVFAGLSLCEHHVRGYDCTQVGGERESSGWEGREKIPWLSRYHGVSWFSSGISDLITPGKKWPSEDWRWQY